MEALRYALRRVAVRGWANADDFWRAHIDETAPFALPVDRAFIGGAAADRLGYAFLAGYSAAIQALFPDVPRNVRGSLAATEEGGAHPKAIRSTLTSVGGELRLSGHKRWVTLAGGELFVLATKGVSEDGRSLLVVVRLERGREGVRIVPQPPPPFVPEIPHAEVVLEGVLIRDADVLPGDGWTDWVKPFRTVEDIHVHAGVTGYLLASAARFGWPNELRQRLAATFTALRALAHERPSSEEIHIALAGTIDQARALIEELQPLFAFAPDEDRARWERDRPLLEIAGRARAQRTERAWAALQG